VPGLAARSIPLVEDAAEALGASLDATPAGAFGRAAALSFNGNKVMTTSGGGMLLSDDVDLISRARYLSTQARQPVSWYEHTEVGYNYRMSNILAALGRAQLSRLDSMIARRREIRDRYAAELADVEGVRLLGGSGDGHVDNCWLTCIVLDPELADASSVIKQLDAVDIEARHLWKPMHAQPVFVGERAFIRGASDELFARGVTLPSGSSLSDDDVERVIVELRSALGVR
jgi:dTDP-4-amino-4,6-dideoxygalactose transaminase